MKKILHIILTILIGGVWIANGIWAKILGNVERHEIIVGRVFDPQIAPTLIVLIGVGELFIAAWIFSQFRPRICAALQISLVLTMNVIEFFIARDILLFGGFNFVFAFIFCLIVAYHASLSHAAISKRQASAH